MAWTAAADAEYKTLRIAQFLGIMNHLPPDRIPPGAFSEAENILPGLADQCRGVVAHNSAAVTGAVQGASPYYRQTNGQKQFLWMANGTLYRDDNVSLQTGFNATAQVEFAWFLDRLYFVNGVGGLYWWDGSQYGKIHPTPVGALVPYVPTPDDNELNDAASPIHTSKYITVYKNHVCLAGASTLAYRVYFSDLTQADTDGAPTYFKGTRALDFQSPGGGSITGLVATNNVLFVLKDDSIFSVTGNELASFVVNTVYADNRQRIGCPSGRTAQVVPGLGMVFQGSDGHFYRIASIEGTDTQFALKRLSKYFSGEYGTGVRTLNFAKLDQSAAGMRGDYYCCSVCTGAATTPNAVWMMNHRNLAAPPDGDPSAEFVPWSVRTFSTASGVSAPSCWAVYNNGTVEYMLGGDSVTGRIWRWETGSYADNGEAIDVWFKVPKLHFGKPENRKTHRHIHITYDGAAASSATITVTVYVDDKAGVDLSSFNITGAPSLWDAAAWDSDVWDVRQTNKTRRLAVNKTGQLFQFRLRNTTNGVGMRIFEILHTYSLGQPV